MIPPNLFRYGSHYQQNRIIHGLFCRSRRIALFRKGIDHLLALIVHRTPRIVNRAGRTFVGIRPSRDLRLARFALRWPKNSLDHFPLYCGQGDVLTVEVFHGDGRSICKGCWACCAVADGTASGGNFRSAPDMIASKGDTPTAIRMPFSFQKAPLIEFYHDSESKFTRCQVRRFIKIRCHEQKQHSTHYLNRVQLVANAGKMAGTCYEERGQQEKNCSPAE